MSKEFRSTSIQLPTAIYLILYRQAQADRRSLNQTINLMLEDWLREHGLLSDQETAEKGAHA